MNVIANFIVCLLGGICGYSVAVMCDNLNRNRIRRKKILEAVAQQREFNRSANSQIVPPNSNRGRNGASYVYAEDFDLASDVLSPLPPPDEKSGADSRQ